MSCGPSATRRTGTGGIDAGPARESAVCLGAGLESADVLRVPVAGGVAVQQTGGDRARRDGAGLVPPRLGPRRLPRPEHRQGGPAVTSPGTLPSLADGNQLLFTPEEAAERLRVRESWLRRRAAARQIPCTFLGKHLRFSAADLAAIVAQNAQAPTGRRPRRRSSSTVRDRDLPPPPQRSVHPPDRDDHNRDDGSSPWPG
jgi:excisionase family DNA binding protein